MAIDHQTEYLRYKIETNYKQSIDIRKEMTEQYGNELTGDAPWMFENDAVYCTTDDQVLFVELLVS